VSKKLNYLASESAAGEELALWQAQEKPGPLANELALLRYMLANAAKQGVPHLAVELCAKLAQMEKINQTLAVDAREWVKPSDLERYRDALCSAIVAEFAAQPQARDLVEFRHHLQEALGHDIDADVWADAVYSYFGDRLDWQDRVERLAERFVENSKVYRDGKLSTQPEPKPQTSMAP
jgi:hypothetical protein